MLGRIEPRVKVTMKEVSSWKAWAAVVGAVVGLWGLAAAGIARDTSSPSKRAVPTTAGTSGSASRVEGLRPLRLVPPDMDAVEDDIDVCAVVDAAGDDEVAGMTELPPVEATEPRLDADVRPPPPPEAFLPMPRAPSPDQDTGLAFRSEPPGDGATGEEEEEENEKEVNPSGAQAPTIGPPPPAFTADLRPAPDPEALAPAPPRTTPDRDTGPVFSNQPPRATDAGDEKY
jgi:hypothetical protein